MTTTLRMFYTRALTLAAFALLMILALAGVAFAQDAATAVEPPTDMIGLIFSSASAAAASIVALVLANVARFLPAGLRGVFEYFTTKSDKDWEPLLDSALNRAEAYVRALGIDATKNRNGWINAMAAGLWQFNPEIVKYFDKNQNGVIDFIEGYLPPTKDVTPGLVALIATRLPEGSAPPSKSAPAAPLPFVAAPAKARKAKELGH